MFLEIAIAVVLGILAGCFTGLVPGLHVNLISVILLSASVYFLRIVHGFTLGAFIIAMAITHSFLNNIPAIFLGAPDSSTVLAVLPGHKMLLKGEGYKAIKLTTMGSLGGLLISVMLVPVLIPGVVLIYGWVEKVMGWLLLLAVAFILYKEKKKFFWASWQFLIAGILGLMVLNMPNLNEPLLAMLSGLFGISTLIVSLNSKVKIPQQNLKSEAKLSKSVWARALGVSVFSGGTVALLPGLGAAEAGVMGNEIAGDLGDEGFLVLIGGIGTVNMSLSLLTFYALDKARNGAIVVVQELLEKINFSELVGFLGVVLVAGCLATILTLFLSKKFAFWVSKINYQKLCIAVIIFVCLLVFYFSGWLGLLVMAVSTCVGMIPSFTGVKKSLNMGCLMIPVIMWFLL